MKQTDISARKKVGAPIWNPRPFNYVVPIPYATEALKSRKALLPVKV